MKTYLLSFLFFMVCSIQGCSNTPLDYTGSWEEVHPEQPETKRVLKITKDHDTYHVADQLYHINTQHITYDETSQGVIDGKQLLSGTNNLMNVIELAPDQQSLTMYSHDNSVIKFKKVS